MRPLIAEIDTQALQHNFDLLARHAGPARVMTLLKANAYGHDTLTVAHALAERSTRLAVACLDEAMPLREAGIATPILVLQGFYNAEEWKTGQSLGDIEWVVHTPEQWTFLTQCSQPCALWLKFDTGMGRLGLPDNEATHYIRSALESPHTLTGVMTHYACADQPESDAFNRQSRRVAALATQTPQGVAFSASNSAALLNGPHPREDWVRPGISLFGCAPFPDMTGPQLGLRAAMCLRSQVIAIRHLAPGQSVGYGATWTARRHSRIAVIAAGYGDGYPRHARPGTPVRIGEQLVPLVGRVSMDMLTVDVTDCPSARPGTTVELWGPGLSADEIARHADTISYTLTTGLTARVPRQRRN